MLLSKNALTETSRIIWMPRPRQLDTQNKSQGLQVHLIQPPHDRQRNGGPERPGGLSRSHGNVAAEPGYLPPDSQASAFWTVPSLLLWLLGTQGPDESGSHRQARHNATPTHLSNCPKRTNADWLAGWHEICILFTCRSLMFKIYRNSSDLPFPPWPPSSGCI